MNPLVHALDHITFRMPNVEQAARWYERVYGLAVVERLHGEIRLVARPNGSTLVPQQEFTLLEGSETTLDHVAFSVADDAALEEAAASLRSQGVAVETPAVREKGMGAAKRFTAPGGFRVEICVSGPLRRRPPGVAPFGLTRVGHLTVTAPQPLEIVRFFQEALGFRLSDQYEEMFAWLRCNRDHHVFACARGSVGVQHMAFEVENWSELQQMLDHFAAENVPVEYGPGRHRAGNNIFIYVIDPFGIRMELFCELQRIDDDATHTPSNYRFAERARNANMWGPAPPLSFVESRNPCCALAQVTGTRSK